MARPYDTDSLAVSGGWNPNLHLTCHHRGIPKWNEEIASFVPDEATPPGMSVAGRAKGTMVLSDAMKEGHDLGLECCLRIRLQICRP